MEQKLKIMKIMVFVMAIVLLTALPVNAGNLEPSAPPGPTMKTLDEVEPRIPISQSDFPLTITASGSYYLTENITATGTAITIDVNDVTIDLMGYCLKGPNTGEHYGVYMDGRSNVEIRNGTIHDFYTAIHEDDYYTGRDHRIISIRVVSNIQNGIYLRGDNHLVKDCIVSNNGHSASDTVYGIKIDDKGRIIGNITCDNGTEATIHVAGIGVGYGCIVTGNIVSGNGKKTASTYGVYASSGSTIADNTVNKNGEESGLVYGIGTTHGSTVSDNCIFYNGKSATGTVYGLKVGGACNVINNTIYYNANQASGEEVCGIKNSMGSSTFTSNIVSANGANSLASEIYGIEAYLRSTLIGNTVSDNGSSATSASVYGIRLSGNSLVDKNSVTNNGSGASSAVNMNDPGDCTFGTNHAP